jgi:DNA-binding PadR family transcriptional regulator
MSLQNAVLGILTYSPMNGYYLRRIFDKSINYSWTASLSQIYRELGVLEKKGYVASSIQQQDDRPDKRIYSITEEGRKAFNEWLTDFPETFSAPKRDEFMLRIFFGSKIEKAELIKQFKRFIQEREAFKEIMAEGKETIKEMSKTMKKKTDGLSMVREELYWRFIAKRALMTNQVLIDWAEECINELENSPLYEEGKI